MATAIPVDGFTDGTATYDTDRDWTGISLADLPLWDINAVAAMLGVGHLLDRMPNYLSGGEKQRVALGRALAPRPKILCLDEPLNALDDKTHAEMVSLLKNVAGSHAVTTLHITHSLQEAERLADRIYIMDENGLRLATGEDSSLRAADVEVELRSEV